MARNTFEDPSLTFPAYEWAIGHREEQEAGRDLTASATANVANTQVVVQQGDMGPVKFTYAGSILTREQLVSMWQWFNLCQYQTIYFTDYAGDKYEVLITSFKPVRKSGQNFRGGAGAPRWYWEYTIELTVIRNIAGPMFDAGLPA